MICPIKHFFNQAMFFLHQLYHTKVGSNKGYKISKFSLLQKISSPVVVPCMLLTDANSLVIWKSKLTPRMNIKNCDVLVGSVDSSRARKYHKKLLAFCCSCTTTFFTSSTVLRTTELAKRLIIANKSEFLKQKSFTALWLPSIKGFPCSIIFCTIL